MIRSHRRQFIWSFLSLWATLSLLMPSLSWACPKMAPLGSTSARTCCASHTVAPTAHRCCHQVPVPASDTSGDTSKGTPTISQATNFAASLIDATHALSTPAALPVARAASPAEIELLSTPATAALLKPQHSPPQSSGRSPPL
jgi:hypothetical protein